LWRLLGSASKRRTFPPWRLAVAVCHGRAPWNTIGNHSFRATGITACLANGGTLEHAQTMAARESPRTTKLYDRTKETRRGGADQAVMTPSGFTKLK
jgi:hypothetical protein